jgi:hypothetical protein
MGVSRARRFQHSAAATAMASSEHTRWSWSGAGNAAAGLDAGLDADLDREDFSRAMLGAYPFFGGIRSLLQRSICANPFAVEAAVLKCNCPWS